MVSGRDRAFLVAMYFFIAWKLLTIAALLGTSAIAFTLVWDPTGAFLIPVAGFLALVGVYALEQMRNALSMPHV